MSDKPVRLELVCKSFAGVEVLRDISLEVERGEFVAIVGPSGCGKTTLLNLISGFDEPSAGDLVTSGHIRTVYQHGGLFPWLTTAENMLLALRQIEDVAERQRQLKELLDLIGLDGFGDHFPHQLSCGMRQRVELARALAGETDILLMDEPFSSLDYLTRFRLRQEFVRLLRERPRTVVLVTHDIEEAVQLADRIVVLSERPARIGCELRLEVPRPRDITNSNVVGAVDRILFEMGLQTEISHMLARKARALD